jgi:hypothetical protein
MPKATYSVSAQGVAATSANYVLGIIEAGPAKTLRLQRLIIWNPGMLTTAAQMNIAIIGQTTVGTGTTVTPTPMDSTDYAFSGKVRIPGSTLGSTGATIGTGSVWVPGAVGVFNPPTILDFNNGNNEKPPTIYSGIVAPLAVTSMSNTNWYEIATLGNTVWNTYATGGLAAPAIGSIFQASGAGTGTGTVIPLVLATGISVGQTYSIGSLGTTTTAQWQAAGAPAYVNTGTVFTATAAAAGGTGLCVLLGSGAGIAVVAVNGAAGAAGLSYTLEFTEN